MTLPPPRRKRSATSPLPQGQAPEALTPEQEAALIEAYRQGLREAIAWYSNGAKWKRELWVCSNFVRRLGISATPADFAPVDQREQAPDVLYRGGRFEIKELLDPDRLRHKEYKQALERSKDLTKREQLVELFTPKEQTLSAIFDEIVADLPTWTALYERKFRASLDLLIYYNRVHRHFFRPPTLPSETDLSRFGFRSVSVYTGSVSWVVWGAPTAPDWLVKHIAQV